MATPSVPHELPALLVEAARILDREGLVGSVGHVSARVSPEAFLITPRRAPGAATADDLLVIDLGGRVLEGRTEPNSEWPIHAGVYRARPDVGGIAHTHSFNAIALGIAGVAIRPVHLWGAGFGAGVPVFEEIEYIRTAASGDRMAAALGRARAVLLRGHGSVIVGRDVREAVLGAIELEYNCALQVVAMAIGTPRYFTPAEAAAVIGNPPRLWDYFRRRAGVEAP